MVISNSENNFGYYSFTLIKSFFDYELYKRSQTTQYKKRQCVVKNLVLPKEKSGLCPQFLESNTYTRGTYQVVGVFTLIFMVGPSDRT